MGNKVQGSSNTGSITPQKKSKNIFSNLFSGDKQKSKSSQKEGLYAEEKLFENYESKS
jgi:hypothetical protein